MDTSWVGLLIWQSSRPAGPSKDWPSSSEAPTCAEQGFMCPWRVALQVHVQFHQDEDPQRSCINWFLGQIKFVFPMWNSRTYFCLWIEIDARIPASLLCSAFSTLTWRLMTHGCFNFSGLGETWSQRFLMFYVRFGALWVRTSSAVLP